MPHGPWRRSAWLAVLLLLAAACSSGSDRATEEPPVSPPADSATAPPTESPAGQGGEQGQGQGGGRPTPEVLRFSAPKLGGGTLEGADYSGRDVAIWFWAPW